ncbi:hypothetical protein F5B17DRAFT_394027 [Nemania serpens]|nr:hypothetical protein F5B17DRAFT_394027 [Nemania serpens]
MKIPSLLILVSAGFSHTYMLARRTRLCLPETKDSRSVPSAGSNKAVADRTTKNKARRNRVTNLSTALLFRNKA